MLLLLRAANSIAIPHFSARSRVVCFLIDSFSTFSRIRRGPALRPSQALVSRMHSPCEPLLVCDSQQQGAECSSFLGVESGKQSILVFSRELPDPFQCILACACQVQGIQAPVVRIRPSLNETSLLKAVQQRDQSAGMCPEAAGKLLLTQSSCHAQKPENPGIRWL